MRYDKVIMSNAQSMAGNFKLSIIDLRNAIDLSLQFIVTNASSPTGTAAIQFANDCTVNADGTISGGNFSVDASMAAAPWSRPTVPRSSTALKWATCSHAWSYTTGTGTGNLTVIGLARRAHNA
jgi:hypothetical protein